MCLLEQVPSDGSGIGEDSKAHWHMQVALLKDLSPLEKSSLLNCPAARNTEDLQLFARLYPYFSGKHHLEEIMYYENLRRSQLLTLIDKFKDVLITATHEQLYQMDGWMRK